VGDARGGVCLGVVRKVWVLSSEVRQWIVEPGAAWKNLFSFIPLVICIFIADRRVR
jgi:hypothetical protein